MIFDPIALTEAVTPSAVQVNLKNRKYGMALSMSFHLNEFALVKTVIEDTPYESISTVVRSVGQAHLNQLIQFLSKCMEDSPHVEYYLQWCLELLQTHGLFMEKNRGKFLRYVLLPSIVKMRKLFVPALIFHFQVVQGIIPSGTVQIHRC
jgi:periodic tryptophan protein 2